jgi:CHAT domain-containing protein
MPRGRKDFGLDVQCKRWRQRGTLNRSASPLPTYSSILFLLLALTSLPTCARRRDPQAALDHATQTFQHGELAAATDEAEKDYKEFYGLGANWAWKFLVLEADSLEWRGMNDQALSLLGAEPVPLPSAELAIQKEWLEASAYISLQRLAEAEHKLSDMERRCAAMDYVACGDLRPRGWLEMARGHFEQAQRLFERTVTSARTRSDHFLEACTLLDLTSSELQQEHFDAALDWSENAYRQATAIGAESVAQVALGNRGWAYYRLGEPEKAFGLFLEARNRAHQIGATADEVKWLTTAGYVYLDAHDYSEAEQSYKQALDLAQQINSKEDILNALMSLALVSERTGKLEQARDYADQTIAMAPAEGNRLDVLYPMLVKGQVAAKMRDTALAEKLFREVEQDPKSHVFLKWEAEHSLARLYEDQNQADGANREYRAALSTFEAARSSLQHEESSLPFPANASRIYDDYIHFLVSRGKTSEALQVAEYSRGRTLAEGLGVLRKGSSFKPDSLNAEQIAGRAGGTIFFYWLGEKQSYLWTISPQKTTLVPLPAASEIDAAVQRFRKALIGPQDVLETANEDGLYRMLVAPAKGLVARNAKVFIIPDGSLNSLNFETLLVSDPKPHYWIEDVTIANASSLRLLSASHTATRKIASNLLLFGDAVAPNKDYPELSKAAVEMENIKKHFPAAQQQVFNRNQATPPAYLASQPERFSYIHFVAHGTASRLSPLDSAIVLSKATAEEDSFKLYARDIIHHPLRAELVTISTCYGAGSRAYSGEGMVGLSWAFLRAGAHNVVGALWEVSDASTAQLMDQLYSELKKGKSPGAALRSAKLSLLTSGGAFRRPFYWAPFQLFTGS